MSARGPLGETIWGHAEGLAHDYNGALAQLYNAEDRRGVLAANLSAADAEVEAAKREAERYGESTARAFQDVPISPNGDSSFVNDPGFIANPGFRVIADRATLLPRLSEASIKHIRGVRDAMANRWGLALDEIGLIRTREVAGHRSKAVVTYLGAAGLPQSTYDEIMSPGADDYEYILEVDGKTYDTRKGMTRGAYLGLWLGSPDGTASMPFTGFGMEIDRQEQISSAKFAPPPLMDNFRHVWNRNFHRVAEITAAATYRQPATLLTGEKPDNSGAITYAFTNEDRVMPLFQQADSNTNAALESGYGADYRYELGFRPAVIIE